jgi:hypothetical protein
MPVSTRKNRKMLESARINGREANVLQQISLPDENGFIPILNLIANINDITMQTLINKEQLAFNQTILQLRLANISVMNVQAIDSQNRLLNIVLTSFNNLITSFNADNNNATQLNISNEILSTITNLNNLNVTTLQPQLNTAYNKAILKFQNSTHNSTINMVTSLATYAELLINNNVLDLNVLYQNLQNNINQTETECIDQINMLHNFIFNENGKMVDPSEFYLSTLQNAVTLIQTQLSNNTNILNLIK